MKEQELRSFRGTVEVREGPSGPMIVGYGAVYNRDSSDMGFIEQVDPGAFTKTLQEADVRGLANHDPNWLLGRTKSGTMRLRSDANGLYYEIDVNPNDPDGQRALAKVQRGDWDGSSFSFNTIRDEWNWDAQPPQRRLLEVALLDCGPVTFPAYPDASATSRALAPIAEKVGRPVDELVTALKTGEIRSLVAPAIPSEDRADDPNDLPDSAFLYIEPGGKKDDDGKTVPRRLRHLPYKNADGSIDLGRLRNALSRLGQDDTGGTNDGNWLSDSLRKELIAKAQKILAANTDAKNSLEEENVETRVGKMISSKNMEALQGLHDSLSSALSGLRDLLDAAKTGAPGDSEVGDTDADLPADEQDSERDLIDSALGGAPPDSDVAAAASALNGDYDPDEGKNSLSLVSAGVELRRRLLALDEAA